MRCSLGLLPCDYCCNGNHKPLCPKEFVCFMRYELDSLLQEGQVDFMKHVDNTDQNIVCARHLEKAYGKYCAYSQVNSNN
jgi:hypothetical protein